jgi:ankyrin repeat protein
MARRTSAEQKAWVLEGDWGWKSGCDAAPKQKITALMFHAANGDSKKVARLLSTSDAKAEDEDGWTALMFAAGRGDIATVDLLLPLSDIHASNSSYDGGPHAGRWNALSIAAARGNASLLERLLQAVKPASAMTVDQVIAEAAIAGSIDCLVMMGSRVGEPEGPGALVGQYALHCAACRGRIASVEYLIRMFARRGPLRKLAWHGFSPLSAAAENGHADCVAALLPHIDARKKDCVGNTALIDAAAKGRLECVRLLLPRSDSGARGMHGRRGETALLAAAANGHDECVAELLKSGNLAARDTGGYNALMLAAEHGHSQCLQLLAARLDVNAQNNEGETALMIALDNRQFDCARILLPLSDPAITDSEGWSAMTYASNQQCSNPRDDKWKLFDVIFESLAPTFMRRSDNPVWANSQRLLLLNRASEEAVGNYAHDVLTLAPWCHPGLADSDGVTPLMTVCQGCAYGFRTGHEPAFAALLPFSDAKARSGSGMTALMFASEHENGEGVELALPHSDPKAANSIGRTALMLAARAGCANSVKLLIPVSDVDAQDFRGNTALMLAARGGHGHDDHREVLGLLASCGDPLKRRRDGMTALMQAAAHGASECVEVLLQFGGGLDLDDRGRGLVQLADGRRGQPKAAAAIAALLAPLIERGEIEREARLPASSEPKKASRRL